MFKENSFETPERKVNPIRPKSRQINVRRFKMTTILEQFNALVPCFMTFSFKLLCGISEKKVFFSGRASFALQPLTYLETLTLTRALHQNVPK